MSETDSEKDGSKHIIRVELHICNGKDDDCAFLNEDDALEAPLEHYTGPTLGGIIWFLIKAMAIGALLGILLPVVLAMLFHLSGD